MIDFRSDPRARNRVFWNTGGDFTSTELTGIPGETLTILIIDINEDGRDDIVVGDDSFGADKIYLNDGDRVFRSVGAEETAIPWLTQTTMSLDAGDFDNDGRPDIYAAQIAMPDGSAGDHRYCDPAMIALHGENDQCDWHLRNRARAFTNSNSASADCSLIADRSARELCAVRVFVKSSTRAQTPGGCAGLPKGWDKVEQLCVAIASGAKTGTGDASVPVMETIIGRNVLLQNPKQNVFADVAPVLGADRPGWSWNARFVDLDQDGWRDIFVATGYLPKRDFQSNAYYRNLQGTGFVRDSDTFGLSDAIPTAGFVTIDYDRDGDLDVIRSPSVGEAIVHRNDRPDGNSVRVKLRDSQGHAHGLGARVTVEFADLPSQTDTINASGGFASFDPLEVHFGVGEANSIERIRIEWADGGRSEVSGPFDVNSEILIDRR